MTAPGWKRQGVRYMSKDSGNFNAMIFGAPAPFQLWAWAVYGHQFSAEGVEGSLNSARRKANAAIAKILESPR